MDPQSLFYILIAVLVVNFLIDKIIDAHNAKHFNAPIPKPLEDVYDQEAYQKSQNYKKVNYRYSLIASVCSFIVILLFFLFEGFARVDAFARSLVADEIAVGLLFFAILFVMSDLLSMPFSYYHTFVIEEKFGFNRSSKQTFFLDRIKGWLLTGLLGGIVLGAMMWFYLEVGVDFWWYAWIVITLFSVLMNLFYSRWIVPLFNKQTPLPEKSLRTKIENYAEKIGFQLQNIFVIDGSKRTTKANAYFSGFGKEKRITLYDTLIDDLEVDEIVAVLAHEVGHYKRNHIPVNLIVSIALTGITLYLLSLFVSLPVFSYALGVEKPSFHVGLLVFFMLYAPISALTGLLMNLLSREFEYQADDFAKQTFAAEPLISALKKLSKNNLSNLTPHPTYVFVHSSHPTLLSRIEHLKKE